MKVCNCGMGEAHPMLHAINCPFHPGYIIISEWQHKTMRRLWDEIEQDEAEVKP